jgi:hypothetical protein
MFFFKKEGEMLFFEADQWAYIYKFSKFVTRDVVLGATYGPQPSPHHLLVQLKIARISLLL